MSPSQTDSRIAGGAGVVAEDMPDNSRRAMIGSLVGSGGVLVCAAGLVRADEPVPAAAHGSGSSGWYDVKGDFSALGNGNADDTRALQAAINAGSTAVRPVRVPPGVYRITRPLTIPSNTMLIGSAPGLGFGCRIEPSDCAAFVIGGKSESFHCCIENLMIWPRGSAPEYIVSIDNSYSITLRNIRIHEAQENLRRAAVLLLGDTAAGGHGPCTNIIWDNLIVRNDTGQPPVAVLAAKGCGSHRFIAPDLENYRVLLDWQGGQIDWVVPYTERAGRYAVDCNIEHGDDTAYLNTFGGIINTANSGLGCAIRSTTRNFNSFGTLWGATSDLAVYVYSLPSHPVNFHGIEPNLGGTGSARYSGVGGWRKFVHFPQQSLRTSHSLQIAIPAHGQSRTEIKIPGVAAGEYWARVTVNCELGRAQLGAFVSNADTVTIVADNDGDKQINLGGIFVVECGIA